MLLLLDCCLRVQGHLGDWIYRLFSDIQGRHASGVQLKKMMQKAHMSFVT